MKTNLISVSGILRKTVGGAIIPEGFDLYHGMAAMGQLVLVAHGERDGELANWLELHGLIRHSFVSAAGRLAASELRRDGYDIGMVFVADPAEAIDIIEAGHTAVLFTHARYAQPEWRPDAAKGVRPWAEIVELTTKTAKMKAADQRLRSEE